MSPGWKVVIAVLVFELVAIFTVPVGSRWRRFLVAPALFLAHAGGTIHGLIDAMRGKRPRR